MTKLYLILSFCLIATCCQTESSITNKSPKTVDRDYFTYKLYDDLSENIVEAIHSKLIENYSRILTDLEVASMSKVTVNIWQNENNFLDNMEITIGRRYEGAGGWVYSSRDIRILHRSGTTPQIVLHEFCHAVSLVVNNRIGNNPRWLWETVAVYEAGEFVNPKTLSYLVNGNFPTLLELNADFSVNSLKVYDVGFLIGEFIVEKYGKSKFVELILSNGNILQTLQCSVEDFEMDWKEFVVSKYLIN
jgi:hypothetical protein